MQAYIWDRFWLKPRSVPFILLGVLLLPFHFSCNTLYGWNIHAPGLMSEGFARDIPSIANRVGLFVPEELTTYVSKDKGTWLSDPQTYYIGEAFVPMLVEAFQQGFEEFVLFETVPTPAMMRRYGIEYLAVVQIEHFANRKHFRGQGLDLYTETTLFDPELNLMGRFQTHGASEAPQVFAKRGGVEVNLNHAIEANLRSVIQYAQDLIQTQKVGV